MARLWNENRRPSTIYRDNQVHREYDKLMSELGEIGYFVSRSEIYRRVALRVFLSPKTVERILNHTSVLT